MNAERFATVLPLPVPEITRRRLWFLYCVVGLIKAEIEELTGWPRARINSSLRKWDLTMWSETSVETRFRLEQVVASQLGAPVIDIILNPERIQNARHALQDRMRAALQAGTVDWEAIDRLPEPPQRNQRR